MPIPGYITWQEMSIEWLYHGTYQEAIDKMLVSGRVSSGGIVKPPSFWGTERIAEYYAEVVSDYEGSLEPRLIRVPLSRFNKAGFKVDRPSVQEPISWALEETEDDLARHWQASRKTWRDCLVIFESVKYDLPMRITEEDVQDF